MEVVCNHACKVTENNIHIQDSYDVTTKSDMREMLYAIQYRYPECNSFKRGYKSLIAEWRVHNRLYRWGIEKGRTGSVDLDYPLKWYVEFIYRILGI